MASDESTLFDFEDGSLEGTITMQGEKTKAVEGYKGFRRLAKNKLRLDIQRLPAFWLELSFEKASKGQFLARSGHCYLVTVKGRMSDDPRSLTVHQEDEQRLAIKAVDGEMEVQLPSKFLSEL